MAETAQGDYATLFDLAARVSEFVTAMEIVLMEERGAFENYGQLIFAGLAERADYSPILNAMNNKDRAAYEVLCSELEAVSQLEIIGNHSKVSDQFKLRAAAPGIRMQELLVSIVAREKFLTEEEMIDLWVKDTGAESDVTLLHQYKAPLLAHLVGEASPKPS